MMVAFCCNVLVWMDYQIRNNSDDKKGEDLINVYVVICFIIVGLLMLVILGFCLFHLVLLCKGKTTRQFIKEKKGEKTNHQIR